MLSKHSAKGTYYEGQELINIGTVNHYSIVDGIALHPKYFDWFNRIISDMACNNNAAFGLTSQSSHQRLQQLRL